MKKILNAILKIRPDSQVSLICKDENSDNFDNIEFNWNGEVAISKSDIETKITEMETADAQKVIDKANAKAKLQAAEYTPLTEDEAKTIVL